mmetsp:Transcript_14423/g.21668  ORF Transcript_14423/g.21668 Transcript_14423/m.21668 type:complete len:1392 (+) Transcript_14423:58-4233(+)
MGNEISAAKIDIIEDSRSSERKRTVIADATKSLAKSQINHQFVWYYPNWESYLDESGNTYYYNDLTKETKWDPRELDDGYEGQLESTQEDIEWEGPAPTLGESGKTFSRTSSLEEYYAKKTQQMEERKEELKADPFAHWKELSRVGKIDYLTVEEHVIESTDVVAEVSQGSFEPELLYKLPWAYKVQQLGAAVKACYLEVGDMFDSSKYDNCNDVPRYDDGGLVMWWSDLEEMHMAVNIVIDSGVVGQEAEHYSEEMKKLQEIASTGNEEDMLEGFLARKIQVDNELTSLRARCFAAVCMDNGPTREQLDNIYSYLKENVNSDTVLDDIQDEMEEVVSTVVEQKHRYMVDVVLMMGLLEDEEERLEKRIRNFKGGRRRLGAQSDDQEDSQDELDEEQLGVGDSAALNEMTGQVEEGLIVECDPEGGSMPQSVNGTIDDSELLAAADRATVKSKIAEQASEASKLSEELMHQKSQKSKALQERLAKKRAEREKQLMEEGLSSEEVVAKVELEIIEEKAAAEDEMDRMVTEALKTKDLEIKEKLDKVADEEASRISSEIEEERVMKVEALKHDLDDQRKRREEEVMKEMNCGAAAAAAIVEDEIAEKEAEEMKKIEDELRLKAEKRRMAVVESIRDEHLKTAEQLESELQSQKERKIKSLKNRLEKRKEARANELMNSGVSVDEAVAVADIEVKGEIEAEMKKVEEESQAQLEEAKMATVNALKAVQEKEAARLEQDLLHRESRQKRSLHERLANREKKREKALQEDGFSEDEAKQIAEEEQKTAEAKALEAIEMEMKTIKDAQEAESKRLDEYHSVKRESNKKSLEDRLAKRKAKKETELTPEEKMEQFLKSVRERQKQNLDKLSAFIDAEKSKAIAAAESNMSLESENHTDPIHTAMLFAVVKESMLTGYKKQCVYQVRAIKDNQQPRDLSPEEHRAAMVTASEQLISRHARDQKGMMDTQIAEQQRTRVKLEEDCAPIEKIMDMEEKYYKRNVDSVRKQQAKLFLALAGVHVDVSLLANTSSAADPDALDDEDDIFGDSHAASTVFSEDACAWFSGVMGLYSVYDKVPDALISKLQHVMMQIKVEVQKGNAKALEVAPAGAVLYQLSLAVLKAICDAFEQQISNALLVPSYSSASSRDIKEAISKSVDKMRSNLTLEAAFNAGEASDFVKTHFKTALDQFLENPVIPTHAFLEALKSMKSMQSANAKTTGSGENPTAAVDELRDRKSRMIKSIETKVERKRRDIHEKFRKRLEHKTHECKEAKIELPEDFSSSEESAQREEIINLDLAFEEVKDIINSSSADNLKLVSVDGLMLALEKKLKGDSVESLDFKQLELEAQKENEKLEAKRLMKMQKDEAEKLDVMLKVQRAREQQALQKRLLARKSKSKKSA